MPRVRCVVGSIVCLTMALAGCGRSPAAPSPPAQLAGISPTSGVQGATVTLTITGSHFTAGATSRLSISGGGITVSNVTVESATTAKATAAIAPDAPLGKRTVTFAGGAAGVSGSVSFTVVPPPPTVVAIAPAEGTPGARVTIKVTGTHFVPDATSIEVSGTGVRIGDTAVTDATSLSATLTIAADAAPGLRELTVTTPGGTAARPFTVLGAVPSIGRFIARPSTIAAGASSTLSWRDVTNAATCTIDHGVGHVRCADDGARVTPPTTTTYTITVTNAAGATATGRATVTVVPAPAIGSLTASPSSITLGGTATLAWRGITHATTCTIDHGVGPVSCANGSTTVAPPSTTTYTLTATGDGGSTTATTTVTVHAAAPGIGAFSASPSTIAVGGTATLAWSGITDATACAIDHGIGPVSCANGSTSVTPASTTSYTLTATGDGGATTATGLVTVAPPPTLAGISPASGERATTVAVTLTGTNFVVGGTSVAVSGGGVAVSGVTVAGATSVTADLTIEGTTALGARTLTVTTAGGTSGGVTFTVTAPSGMATFATAGSHTFVVPAGVTAITIDAFGAAGGTGSAAGAPGARAVATAVPVTPGETLTILVGGRGEDGLSTFPSLTPCAGGAGGFNGGGAGGGCSSPSLDPGGGGGGGASEIRRGVTPLLIAGGGGGGGAGVSGGSGGAGGQSGADGVVGTGGSPPVLPGGGKGATPTSGGTGGNGATASGGTGSAGQGGAGGGASTGGAGGGGGGGVFGGGGGGTADPVAGGGGGGGSSMGPVGTTFTTGADAANGGHGKVVISWS